MQIELFIARNFPQSLRKIIYSAKLSQVRDRKNCLAETSGFYRNVIDLPLIPNPTGVTEFAFATEFLVI